jgi:hypothetical protein
MWFHSLVLLLFPYCFIEHDHFLTTLTVFPRDIEGFPQVSHSLTMCSQRNHPFSHGFSHVFLSFPWLFHGFPHGFRGRPGALHVAKAVLLAGSTVGAELCLAERAVPNGFRGGG